MKNLLKIATIIAALGLMAAFAGCSNASDGPAPIPTPTPTPDPSPTPTTTTFTVSFDANDGSQNPAKATQIFTAGVPQKLTPVAELGFKRDNFAFAGWALSSAASEAAYADKAEYTGNISITLYAVWTPIYTVIFDSKGGSDVTEQKVTSGQTVAKPDDPTKDHFNFVAWFSDEACQTPFDFTAPITAPTTLYAKWSNLPVYVVTFDLGGGKYGASDSYTQNVETGGKVFRPASDPTKDDSVGADVTTKYTFDNWYADSGCNTLFDFDATAISGPTTVYAKWSETKYCAVKISSGIEHGSVSSDAAEHIAAGTLVTLAASPSAGYKFGAYTVTDADSNPVTVTDGKFTMPASPVTVSASFIAIEYTITCGTQESGTLTADKAKASIGTTVTLTVSANDGYELTKLLVKDSGGADVSVTEIEAGASYTFTMPASPVTVTAVFIVEEIISHIPLTLEAIEAGANVTFRNKASGPVTYRVNEGDSQAIASGAEVVIPLPNVGDKVNFYGDNATYVTSNKYSNIACDKDCYVYGNIMSLVDSANYESAKKLTGEYTFYGLFKNNAHIKNKAGKDLLLPATTLADKCYNSMFYGCASLASAPELPATTLANYCYYSMFEGCASLASAPELPATTLADSCYREMFSGCTSLASAPALPATTMRDYCYAGMFSGCANLVSAPALPAMTLANYCYYIMFEGCASLASAPELPAGWLADYCYYGMFEGCASLASAPALPAIWLAKWCYASMFSGCASLTSAPELPATKLASQCYYYMFSGCASLSSVTCFAVDISAKDCINWLEGVSSTGTFTGCVKWSRESINIPVGWTVSLTLDMKRRPLTLEAIEAGSIVTFANNAAGPVYYYTVNSANKQKIEGTVTKKISLSNAGDWVCFYGDNATYATSIKYSNIACDKDCYVYGNIMSLVNSAKELTEEHTFDGLFKDNAHIKNKAGEDLLLPATTLAKWCYYEMFSGCAGLASAPELPATTLAGWCYNRMFYGCTSLASVTCLATDISAISCTTGWLEGVKATGTFTKAADMTNWSRDSSGIPEGWTVVDYQE